jgi:LacI family transcriptional regulator
MIERRMARPAVIHGALTSSATADRVNGFRDAMLRAGHPLGPGQIVAGEGLDHIAIGYEGMARLLAKGRPPDAVFCSSDLIAFGAHRRAREAGLAERAIMFIGFDDNPLNDWVAPWLSSVRVPYASVGPAIVSALEELWRGTIPAPHLLGHEMVLRDDPPDAEKRSRA